MFEKEHAATWTEEIFKIKEVINKSSPPTFIIEDLLGEEIKASFTRSKYRKCNCLHHLLLKKYFVDVNVKESQKYWLAGEGTPKNSCNGYLRRTYE